MNCQDTFRRAFKGLVAGSVLSLFLAVPSFAVPGVVDVYMVAKGFNKTLPDGTTVPMWGFALDADGNLATDGGETPTVPGPMITVPDTGATLNIHLRNDLTDSVSLVIPGQLSALQPARFLDAQGRSRVRSFDHETLSGQTGTYTWTNLRPGTFIYQSGSRPSVQVPMGLYGGVKKDYGPGAAYQSTARVDASYDSEVVLFFSEIDPALNAAVVGGTFGTAAYPGVINYKPDYFLVNGEPFDSAAAGLSTIAAGNVDERILVRFLNAGLMSHAPTIDGMYMDILAEDGNLYPYAKNQYSFLLAAGKTRDAILNQKETGVYPLYDRRLYLRSSSATNGGMLNYLEITSAAGSPVAVNDSYFVDEEGQLTVALASGVLNNDSDPDLDPISAVLVSDVYNGSLTLNGDGSFSYTPSADFNGTEFFEYKANDGGGDSNIATVTITVNPINDQPVTVDDGVSAMESVATVLDLLSNDYDVDGDDLVITNLSQPANGTTQLNGDGTVTYTSNMPFVGTDTFTYTTNDLTVDGNTGTVTVTVIPFVNTPPVAENDYARTTRNTPVTIYVLDNDSDSDGTLDPATVRVVRTPRRGGQAVVNGDGSITFTPRLRFKGTDLFRYTVDDNNGGTSNKATVRINVVR